MKISLSSDTLSRLIQGLSKAIPTKPSIAILDHFLFEVEGDKLTVTASDNENVMKATADILESDIDSGEPTRFCVHARLIADFLKNLPVQPLTFVVEEKEITVRYENGQICFPCVSGKEYPSIEMLTGDCSSTTLPSSMLQDDITRTSSFVAQDTMRPVLSALCFNFKENGLDVVSCNGQVLMMDTHRGITLENENRFLLPAKPAALLRYWTAKDLFDITIQFNGNAARFSGANWQLTCRLVEGRYPHYKAVIPVNNDKTLLIDKQQLQVAIRRMLPMGSQSLKAVRMDLDTKSVSLSCENVDYNTSAKESVACDYSGEAMRIGLNGEQLNAILSHMPSDQVKMTFKESCKPVLIFPAESSEDVRITALLMPVFIAE